MRKIVKYFLVFIFITLFSAFVTNSYADSNWQTAVPSFPSCTDISNNATLVWDKTGENTVAGESQPIQGLDKVFYLNSTQTVQCLYANNLCLQTNFWKTDQNVNGWTSVNGTVFGLGNDTYLTQNSQFSCNAPTPTVSISPYPTPQVSPCDTPTATPSATVAPASIPSNSGASASSGSSSSSSSGGSSSSSNTNNNTSTSVSTPTNAPDTGRVVL